MTSRYPEITWTIESTEDGERARRGLYASLEMTEMNARLINQAKPECQAEVFERTIELQL